MRIGAGKHRGRRLAAPPGAAVRPTGDRVRQAIFNILEHGRLGSRDGSPLPGARVLDAFCGTGAMALEAVSRGAAEATLIDIDPAALAVARTNARGIGAPGAVRFVLADVTSSGGRTARPHATAPADLVFLDPPYHADLAPAALAALRDLGWIGSGTLVVVELASGRDFVVPEGFEELDRRRWGAAQAAFLRAA